MASEESERSAGDSHHFALPNGTKLFEFEIDKVLGHGGFGITYLATDMHLQEQVAIKEYLPNELAVRLSSKEVSPKSGGSRADFEAGLKAFLEEARLVARVKHSNIVRVRRFFEFQGTGYIVQEYEEGTTLSQRLGKGSLPEQELRTILLKVLDGLEYAHERAILHRDVKPSNIMLRKDGTPVLIDFGAARDFASRHSRSITAIASPGYTPPEQFGIGGEQGPWTDIYALGAVLYRCVTGKPPIDSLRRLRKDALVPASVEASGNYDPVLLKLIDWMLQIEESDRPASANAVREALQGIDAETAAHPAVLSKAKPAPAERATSGGAAKLAKERDKPRIVGEKKESKPISPLLRNIGIGAGVAVVVLLGLLFLFRQDDKVQDRVGEQKRQQRTQQISEEELARLEQRLLEAGKNVSDLDRFVRSCGTSCPAAVRSKALDMLDRLKTAETERFRAHFSSVLALLSPQDHAALFNVEQRVLNNRFPGGQGENWIGPTGAGGNVRTVYVPGEPEDCRTIRHEIRARVVQGLVCRGADGMWGVKPLRKATSVIDKLPDELSAEDRSKALALEKRLLEIKFPRRDGENWSGESVRGNVRIIHFSSAPENCRTVRHEVSFSTGTKSFAQGQLCKDADGRWVAEVQ